eukprot:8261430-Lingulodinium_polyedra.AAC.1
MRHNLTFENSPPFTCLGHPASGFGYFGNYFTGQGHSDLDLLFRIVKLARARAPAGKKRARARVHARTHARTPT